MASKRFLIVPEDSSAARMPLPGVTMARATLLRSARFIEVLQKHHALAHQNRRLSGHCLENVRRSGGVCEARGTPRATCQAILGSSSPLLYRLAISAVVSTFLILLAWPAVLNSCSRCLHSLAIASIAGLRYLRGSNSSGLSFSTLRIWPVIAMRLSVSMLILRTPFL